MRYTTSATLWDLRWIIGVFLLCNMMMVGGCVVLNEEQQAEMNQINEDISYLRTSMSQAIADLSKLNPVREELTAKIKDVLAKVKAGEIPTAEGVALIETYRKHEESIIGTIESLTLKYKEGEQRVKSLMAAQKKLRESGVPGWQIGLSAVFNIALGALGVRQYRKASTLGTAFGVVSRSLDNTKGEVGVLVEAEIAKTEGMSLDKMRKLHGAAKSGNL